MIFFPDDVGLEIHSGGGRWVDHFGSSLKAATRAAIADKNLHQGGAFMFGYWKDRLFQICCGLYLLNRFCLKPIFRTPFLHNYFDDLLLIPCALPLQLFLHRKLGLRRNDHWPDLGEIAFHLAIWSALFEWIGPHIIRTTGDVWDVAAYAFGAGVAALWWRDWPRMKAPLKPSE